MRLAVLVLAAGESTRLKSRRSKMLHCVAGKPIIRSAFDTALALSADEIVFVVGKNGDQIRQALGEDRVHYVCQAERKGTGHAALQGRPALEGRSDIVVIFYADMPLIQVDTLRQLVEVQSQGRTVLTMLTLISEDSMGYGRIVRGEDGRVLASIEEKVCTPQQLQIKEINPSVYCFDADWLWSHIDQIPLNPVKQEYFLTDMVGIAVAGGRRVEAIVSHDPDELLGINNRIQLSQAEAIVRRRVNERWMLEGVTLQDPSSTYIDAAVKLGRDTVILANTHLRGQTTIGEACTIGPNAVIEESTVGDRCRVTASLVEGASVRDGDSVGPYTWLTPAGGHRSARSKAHTEKKE